MDNPLVSIICLCYNHQDYIEEAVQSALNQSYKNIEIIIVDDCSTDGSGDVIKRLEKSNPEIKTILLERNVGSTKAFNKGLNHSSGQFIIDLATDDILLENRVENGLDEFAKYDLSYGVNFTNAINIDSNSQELGCHYPIDAVGKAISPPPLGDIYKELIQRYFICAPTMMTRREVFDYLNGYDEELAYEDFDFWVRSSREFNYCYTDKVLFKRRVLAGSMSANQYKRKSPQMESTFKVCKKIKGLNQSKEEDKALQRRIYLEMKQCLKVFNLNLLFKYCGLMVKI